MYNEITCRLYSCHSYINYTHVSQSSSYIPESAFPLILEGPQFEFTPIYPPEPSARNSSETTYGIRLFTTESCELDGQPVFTTMSEFESVWCSCSNHVFVFLARLFIWDLGWFTIASPTFSWFYEPGCLGLKIVYSCRKFPQIAILMDTMNRDTIIHVEIFPKYLF